MGGMRSRRSVLAVPGSSPKMLAKAQGLPVDEAFLDLEDAVAPDAKAGARKNVVAALNDGDWGGTTRSVQVVEISGERMFRSARFRRHHIEEPVDERSVAGDHVRDSASAAIIRAVKSCPVRSSAEIEW